MWVRDMDLVVQLECLRLSTLEKSARGYTLMYTMGKMT